LLFINYKSIDEKIITGYEYLMKRNAVNACDAWLDAWDSIKAAKLIEKHNKCLR
jgi:hypothetical protein